MKKVALISILISCITFNLNAQNWLDISPDMQQSLNGVYFINDSTGWVVGTTGAIFHTTDKGETWTKQTSNTTKNLNVIHFSDTNNGWAAGKGILHTSDGGNNWAVQYSNDYTDFCYIHFFDNNNGVAINGTYLYYTTNGGLDWLLRASGSYYDFLAASFIDINTGWAITHYGEVYYTSNQGVNWTKIYQADNSYTFKDLFVLNSTTIWIATEKYGNAAILKTTDGSNWTEVYNAYHANAGFRSIFFNDENNGWIVAANSILETTDGGKTLTDRYSLSYDINDIFFTNASNGYFVGYSPQILYYGDQIAPQLSVSDTTLSMDAAALSENTFDVTSNTNWTVESNQNWLSTSFSSAIGNKAVILTALENTMATERVATITISAEGTTPQTITVTQAGATPNLSVSVNALTVGNAKDSTTTFDITSNANWTAVIDQDWISLSSTSGTGNMTITLSIQKNPTTEIRVANITVSATDVSDQIITVTQEAGTTSISRPSPHQNICIFPNPAKDYIIVKNCANNALIKIININGVKILEKKLNDNDKVNITNVPNGTYIIKIETSEKNEVQVFIKQ